ncbi:MNN23 [Symbiodinium natans]|uniref:MNN23 protein n=1 Tax=Symbiodinium natans TaxID=878477 RepID=A0A812MHK4_9DINO|nr:MNN23 [Symbiodinium natans]
MAAHCMPAVHHLGSTTAGLLALCFTMCFGKAVDFEDIFCSDGLTPAECAPFLPSEQRAISSFLQDLQRMPMPKPSSFQGRGIVMSGGPMHVLQALANLAVLREQLQSDLPVEFWHAFELEEAHCRALERRGATCRQLQVPGVYRDFQTILPSIMSSSFKEVLWMDTDLTLLQRPELLFESPQFRRFGALLWPDHWSFDCRPWGQSARSNHVVLKLLDLEHNASDMLHAQEQETGLFLINKEVHWKPICLANFMASRDFFTLVLHGNKDLLRLAFAKLNNSVWLSPLRPGLIGGFMSNGLFLPASMVQFWPANGTFGTGPNGRAVPVFLHQKKVPGNLWVDILTFTTPLGTCSPYFPVPFHPHTMDDILSWRIERTDLDLANRISIADVTWDEAYAEGRRSLRPLLSEESQAMLEPKKAEQEAYVQPEDTDDFVMIAQEEGAGCGCDYNDNFFLYVLSVVSYLQLGYESSVKDDFCEPILQEFDWAPCRVGYATLALLCSQILRSKPEKAVLAKDAAGKLLPLVEPCAQTSPWPLKGLKEFVHDKTRHDFSGPFALEATRFPPSVQRCVPLSMSCWDTRNAWQDRLADGKAARRNALSLSACRFCCDRSVSRPLRAGCFDAVFTEKRCCNALEP